MILYKTYPEPKESEGQDDRDRDYDNMDQGRWEYLAKKLLGYLRIPDPAGMTLLDVGCGAGFFSNEAKRRGYDVLGIDVSKKATNYAAKRFSITAECVSLFNFKTKDRFDVIILSHVLEHISDLDRFMARVRTLLAKNGVILIACPNYRCLMRYIFGGRWYGLQPKQHVWQFTPDTLGNYLKRNGFNSVKIYPSSLDYNPKNVAKKWAFNILTKVAELVNLGDQIIILAGNKLAS